MDALREQFESRVNEIRNRARQQNPTIYEIIPRMTPTLPKISSNEPLILELNLKMEELRDGIRDKAEVMSEINVLAQQIRDDNIRKWQERGEAIAQTIEEKSNNNE